MVDRSEYFRNYYRENPEGYRVRRKRWLDKPENKLKMKIYGKKWRKSNPEWFKKYEEAQKIELGKYIDDLLEKSKCKHCEENDIRCLEFHHRSPEEKKFKISEAIGKRVSMRLLLNELEICDIICANCHKKRTPIINRKYRKDKGIITE